MKGKKLCLLHHFESLHPFVKVNDPIFSHINEIKNIGDNRVRIKLCPRQLT